MNNLLSESRRVCVENLSEAAAEGAIVEPALRSSDGAVVYDSEGLRTPIRKDVATNDGNVWTTANFDALTIRPNVPVKVIWKERLEVSLASVAWDYVEFRLSPVNPSLDWEGTKSWFLKWFDPDDLKQRSEENVYGVVHFMSDPEELDGGTRLFVDFGSAPIVAFHELLDCFAADGFKYCEIR